MAMSNWDAMAWDEKGKSSDGLLVIKNVSIEIYKNWAYLKDEKAWEKDGAFIKHTIMQVHMGNFTYKNFKIVAKRGKQNSIYIVVEYNNYDKKIKKYLYGIGCYAYKGDIMVGVEENTLKDYLKWLKKVSEEDYLDYVEPKEKIRFNQGDAFFIGKNGAKTKIGKQKETIMSKMIQNLQKVKKVKNKR